MLERVVLLWLLVLRRNVHSEMLKNDACRYVPYNRAEPQRGSCSMGPPGSHILPFQALGIETVPTVIARHLPKAGSSALTRLLVALWQSVLRRYKKEENHIWNGQRVTKVTNFQDRWYTNRSHLPAVEFLVSREPLDRFASGYYFRNRHMVSNGNATPPILRLSQYVQKLPENEHDVHLFPQSWFFCNCAPRCNLKRKDWGIPRDCLTSCIPTAQDDATCMNKVQHVLLLEKIQDEWEPFVRDYILYNVHPELSQSILSDVRHGLRTVAGGTNGGRWRSAVLDPTKKVHPPSSGRADSKAVANALRQRHDILSGDSGDASAHRLDAAGFDAILSIQGAAAWSNITKPLCNYLKADYLALASFYKLPAPCLPWLQDTL